jgi:hypothetical protein
VNGSAEVELDLTCRELVDDAARVREGPGDAVELGDDERVAGAAGRACLAKTGSRPVGAGQSVVDVDSFGVTSSAASALRCALRSWASVETRA